MKQRLYLVIANLAFVVEIGLVAVACKTEKGVSEKVEADVSAETSRLTLTSSSMLSDFISSFSLQADSIVIWTDQRPEDCMAVCRDSDLSMATDSLGGFPYGYSIGDGYLSADAKSGFRAGSSVPYGGGKIVIKGLKVDKTAEQKAVTDIVTKDTMSQKEDGSYITNKEESCSNSVFPNWWMIPLAFVAVLVCIIWFFLKRKTGL